MSGLFSIDLRWGDRRESSHACAERTSVFLRGLFGISQAFSEFTALTESHPRHSVWPLNIESLRTLLEQGALRRDVGKRAIDELGFTLNLLNRDATIAIRLHCGVSCGVIPNTCSIEILKIVDDTRSILTLAALTQVFRVAVHAWDPDRGLVTSMKLWESVPQSKKAPNFGWLTYLSKAYAIPQIVRARYHVIPIDNAGNLISVITNDCRLTENADFTPVRDIVSAFAGE